MDAFELADLLAQRAATGRPYLEFQRAPDLSVGLYVLPAGGVDRQGPHAEDEVYWVVSGRALIRVADEDRTVGPGSLVFVGAGVAHQFHAIEEELVILVAFGPAEGSREHGRPPGT